MVGFLKRAFGGGEALSAREEMKEAIAFFIIMMIYADGDIRDEEQRAMMGAMARCKLFSDNTSDDDFSLLKRMERKLNQDADGSSIFCANILDRDDWKFTAAAIMTDIMLADGSMNADELRLLSRLAAKVGIEEAELEAMIATIRALRRPWVGQ